MARKISKSTSLTSPVGRSSANIRFHNRTAKVADGVHWGHLGPFVATFTAAAAANVVNTTFFVAPRRCKVLAASAVFAVAGSHGDPVSLGVVIDEAGDALASGSAVTTFNLKGAPNVAQAGTLVAEAARVVEVGDRLAAVVTGTPTAVANLCVTVILQYID